MCWETGTMYVNKLGVTGNGSDTRVPLPSTDGFEAT